MLGIFASVFRKTTRTEPNPPEPDRARRLRNPRAEDIRREREALDALNRYRRGYW